MNNFKRFIKTQKGKSILFFGFYLVFFIVLFIMFQNKNIQDNDIKKDDNNQVLTIRRLINLDNYKCNFTINIDGKIQKFQGVKDSKNYEIFEDSYFLDIYNINKVIKKSKLIESKDNEKVYEISNEILNELLNTEVKDGINKIVINEKNNYLKITLDLHEYQEKDNYDINLEYWSEL